MPKPAVTCPECGHRAILHKHPHEHAGYVECTNQDCGYFDEHDHQNLNIEEHEPWPTGPEDNPIPRPVYVCEDCGITIDLDDKDPLEDRADAIADRDADNWRDE